jgi:hypothetical protein
MSTISYDEGRLAILLEIVIFSALHIHNSCVLVARQRVLSVLPSVHSALLFCDGSWCGQVVEEQQLLDSVLVVLLHCWELPQIRAFFGQIWFFAHSPFVHSLFVSFEWIWPRRRLDWLLLLLHFLFQQFDQSPFLTFHNSKSIGFEVSQALC